MQITRRLLLFCGVLLLAATIPAQAQFFSLRTVNLRLIYYSKAHEYVVPHIARSFENALSFHQRLFDYTPSEEVTVILQDFGDYASGGANTVPFNLMSIGIAPFSYVYETMPAVERMHLMMIHELAHVVTMDKPSPSDRFFRSLFFGKVSPIADSPPSMLFGYLTGPRWYAPRWFIESIAVFLETWMAGGLGRAQGAYDEMVFRTMVRDSAYIYDVVGLESEGTKVDFQVGANSYLYGTRFVSYLALHYGPQNLVAWFRQSDSSRGYFASEFHRVFGVSLESGWRNWISWEHRWQRENLDSIRQYPVTDFRVISREPVGSVSRAFFDPEEQVIYAGINYPGQTPHLAAISTGSGRIRKLHDVRGGAVFYVTSTAYDPASRTLFYSTDNSHWRDLVAFDLQSGTSRILIKDVRTGDFSFNRADSSLWGVRHFHGISTLVRIPYPYREWNQVFSFDYGTDIFDIDVSPDGRTVIGALTDVSGRQVLIALDVDRLMQGDGTYDVLYDFGNSTPANFVFSDDGRFLFGSSYYSGVSNIVRYEFATRTMEWVTNGESGFFRPIPVSPDSLIVFHYTAKGFVPVMIANTTVHDVSAIRYLGQTVAERHPVVEEWTLPPPSPETINLDSLTLFRGTYNPFHHLRLASIYPVVEGYKKFPAYGLRFTFADPTLLHGLDVTASYTPNAILSPDERWHGAFHYRFWHWSVSGTYNGGNFYDLFGPTRVSRKGYSLSVQFREYLLYEEPESMDYRIAVTGYGGLERLPEFQNISTSFDRFATLTGGLTYSNLTRSLGAVDEEKGFRWNLHSSNTYVNDRLFPRVHSTLMYGFLLPLHHSSIWFHASAGYSPGDRTEPFANFYFGGFGNNTVDHQAVRRYREAYSFPGFELNALGGTNYVKGTIEWDLPPLRFRRLGLPAFYCTWARLALFAGGITTNLDASLFRRSAADVGGQVDFRLVVFSALESTLSFGYAIGLEQNRRREEEFMVSFRVLR